MFTQEFDRYVCDNDTISCEVDGFDCTATVERDDNSDAPWDIDCSHGPVSEWRATDSKAPGEIVLHSDRNSSRFYDFAEAMKIAKRDGWGLDNKAMTALTAKLGRTPTKGEIRHAAVIADFEYLKAWCNDEWDYCGVYVTVDYKGVQLVDKYDVALWGIERNYPGSDNSYLAEVANDLLPEALTIARAKLAEIRT